MSARFRPVWLVLDPFTGSRVLLGLKVEAGLVGSFVAASEQTRAALGASERALAALVLDELHAASEFEALPAAAGPQVVQGDAAEVPASVDDAERWVADRLLGLADAA